MEIKSRGMRLAVHSTHGRDENAYKVLIMRYEGRNHVEDLDIDVKIILE
jgi:hypothetical protein